MLALQRGPIGVALVAQTLAERFQFCRVLALQRGPIGVALVAQTLAESFQLCGHIGVALVAQTRGESAILCGQFGVALVSQTLAETVQLCGIPALLRGQIGFKLFSHLLELYRQCFLLQKKFGILFLVYIAVYHFLCGYARRGAVHAPKLGVDSLLRDERHTLVGTFIVRLDVCVRPRKYVVHIGDTKTQIRFEYSVGSAVRFHGPYGEGTDRYAFICLLIKLRERSARCFVTKLAVGNALL